MACWSRQSITATRVRRRRQGTSLARRGLEGSKRVGRAPVTRPISTIWLGILVSLS